jgi:Zn-dependent protease with chaperone function
MNQTFVDRQAHHRGARWRWTLLAAGAAVTLGLPLSLALTPVAYGALLLILHLVDGVLAVPVAVWRAVDRVAALIPATIDAYPRGLGQVLQTVGPTTAALLLPGVTLTVLMWLGICRLLDRVGLEASVQALGARAPQESVLEEQRFQETLQSVSAGAGIEPPAAFVTEHRSANVALVGPSTEHAAVVVSRRLLNTCDGEEVHALAGHMVASLANGDQLVVSRIESVYLTSAILRALLNAPFGRRGAEVMLAFARAMVRPASTDHATRALSAILREWAEPSTDLTRFFERDTTRPPSVWRGALRLLLLPIYALNMAVFVTADLVEAGLVAPVLAAVARARRYHADASTVELTGNATQLARALRNIAGSLGDPHWAPARLRTIVASDVTDPWRSPGGLTNAHPPAEKRIKRLAGRGAVLSWEPRGLAHRSPHPRLDTMGTLVLLPVMATMAYLSAIVVALTALLAMGAMAAALAAIRGIFLLLQ